MSVDIIDCVFTDTSDSCFTNYQDETGSSNHNLDLAQIGHQVLVAMAPTVLTFGSIATGFYLSSAFQRVVNFFHDESADTADIDYSDALERLFAQDDEDDDEPDWPELDDLFPKPFELAEAACQAFGQLCTFFSSFGTTMKIELTGLAQSAEQLTLKIAEGIREVTERNEEELTYIVNMLYKDNPDISRFSILRRVLASDWPQGCFEMYCDGFRNLFDQSNSAGQLQITGRYQHNTAEDQSETAVDSEATFSVKEMVSFFEQLGFITAVPRDRAQALASMAAQKQHSNTKVPAQSVAEKIQQAIDDEDSELFGEVPEAEGRSDPPETPTVSADCSDFDEADDFCVVSKSCTKLQFD